MVDKLKRERSMYRYMNRYIYSLMGEEIQIETDQYSLVSRKIFKMADF